MENPLYHPGYHVHSYLPSLYTHLIPANMRLAGEYLLGRRAPITENDFVQSDLDAMRQQYDTTRAQMEDEYARNLSAENSRSISNVLGYGNEDDLRRQAAINRFERFASMRRTPVSTYGADAGHVDEMNWRQAIEKSFAEPSFRVGTSLGRYAVQNTPQGDIAFDTYDFNKYGTEKGEALSENMLYNEPVRFLDTAIRKYNLGSPLPVEVMLPKRSQNVWTNPLAR